MFGISLVNRALTSQRFDSFLIRTLFFRRCRSKCWKIPQFDSNDGRYTKQSKTLRATRDTTVDVQFELFHNSRNEIQTKLRASALSSLSWTTNTNTLKTNVRVKPIRPQTSRTTSLTSLRGSASKCPIWHPTFINTTTYSRHSHRRLPSKDIKKMSSKTPMFNRATNHARRNMQKKHGPVENQLCQLCRLVQHPRHLACTDKKCLKHRTTTEFYAAMETLKIVNKYLRTNFFLKNLEKLFLLFFCLINFFHVKMKS